MITILEVNKSKGRIVNYKCSDRHNNIIMVTKPEMIELIKKDQVGNATMQVYKGTVIIRLRKYAEDTKKEDKHIEEVTSQSNVSSVSDYLKKKMSWMKRKTIQQ